MASITSPELSAADVQRAELVLRQILDRIDELGEARTTGGAEAVSRCRDADFTIVPFWNGVAGWC